MARDAKSGSYPYADLAISVGLYTRGYQVGGIQTLPRGNHKAAVILQSMTIIDRASKKSGFDVYLFDSIPTITSSDRQPFEIADSEIGKCAGVVSVYGHEYAESSSNIVLTRSGIGIGIKLNTYNVYAVAVCRNAFTIGHSETDAFTFRYHFELERV